MINLWLDIPVWLRSALVLLALLLPSAIMAWRLNRGYAAWPLIRALFWRFQGLSIVGLLLVAISAAMGVVIVSQDRSLRQAAVGLAERFDLIVAAPGSELDVLAAALLARPQAMRALDPRIYNTLARDPRVTALAPIVFGESYQGMPVVETTQDLLDLMAPRMAAGRGWQFQHEAVSGAHAGTAIGDWIQAEQISSHAVLPADIPPAHGSHDEDAHHNHSHDHGAHDHGSHDDVTTDLLLTPQAMPPGRYRVVGRLPETGTPWDKAIFVPMRGLVNEASPIPGHLSRFRSRLGNLVSEADAFQVPIVIVSAKSMGAVYGMQSDYGLGAQSEAYVPQAEISRLLRLSDNLRAVVAALVAMTWGLICGAIVTGLFVILRLFRRQIGLIRVQGGSRRFVMAVVWNYAAVVTGAGCIMGAGVGYLASGLISTSITSRSAMAVVAGFGWPELYSVAVLFAVMCGLALIPARLAVGRNLARSLRG